MFDTRPQAIEDTMQWLREHNPDLAAEVGYMTLYEGARKICDAYDLDPPLAGEIVEDGATRILNELKDTQHGQ